MDIEDGESERRNSNKEKNKIDENDKIELNCSNEHSDDHKHSTKPDSGDQVMNINITENNGDDNRDVGDKLPTTYDGMKSKYLELKSRYDKLFKHYSELSEEYAVLMHHYSNGVNTNAEQGNKNGNSKMITAGDGNKMDIQSNLSTNTSNGVVICE
eukprot:g6824.t1